MDAGVLSSLMAPSLLWPVGGEEGVDGRGQSLDEKVLANDIIRLLIAEYVIFFEADEAELVGNNKPHAPAFARFKRKLHGHKKSIAALECIRMLHGDAEQDHYHIWTADSAGFIRQTFPQCNTQYMRILMILMY